LINFWHLGLGGSRICCKCFGAGKLGDEKLQKTDVSKNVEKELKKVKRVAKEQWKASLLARTKTYGYFPIRMTHADVSYFSKTRARTNRRASLLSSRLHFLQGVCWAPWKRQLTGFTVRAMDFTRISDEPPVRISRVICSFSKEES